MNQSPPVLPDLDVISLLGTGGMSTVWKAYDRTRSEIVAVKLLNADLAKNPADVELLKAESAAMMAIDNPGFVKSYGFNIHEGSVYYRMEYVDGYNFGALLHRKQHLQESDCLLICESVAAALDFAWNKHGVVHCDIKPENIMINSNGVVKLTDLGLCHIFRFLSGDIQEIPDHVMGTPAYISPEQVYGDVELDCRADIYELAATLYHLATGRLLFPGLDPEGMMRAHCSDEKQANDPRSMRPHLSEGFCQLLEAMLIKNRDYRIPTWQDVLSMALNVERGGAFKPRTTPGISSLSLES